jgi:site-specific recombinase XerD
MKGRTPLSASTMAKDKIRPAAIKVGILLEPGQQFGFHNFRHSLATFLINKGKDVKAIQGLLRNAKASTTLDPYSQAIDASKSYLGIISGLLVIRQRLRDWTLPSLR